MTYRVLFAGILVVALLLAGGRTPAHATGYWNVPSSLCQCIGCGSGAGYHAPLMLRPISCDGWCAHNEIRLPYSPSAPYGCGSCGKCGGDFAAPTMMKPAHVPPLDPAVAPMTRRHRPLFLR